jgi:HEAT repeat protein
MSNGETAIALEVIFDEYKLRRLPRRERFDRVKEILKNQRDESIRWDAVWLAGEIMDEDEKVLSAEDPTIADEIADLMVWILQNDDNGVVKHEAAFQIAVRGMRAKIPDLMHAAERDESELVRHEATEGLGLIRAHEAKEMLRKMALEDPSASVRETAVFVLKRLARLEGRGDYKVEAIL